MKRIFKHFKKAFLLHINNSNICGAHMASTDLSSLHIYFLHIDLWQLWDYYMDGETIRTSGVVNKRL